MIQLAEITIQTLIPESDNKLALDYISEFGIIFGSCIRTAFNIRNRMGRVTSSTKKLKTDIAKELEIRYGVSNTEARAACTLALANYDSQAALTDIYIMEKYEAIKGIERSIKKLEKLAKKASVHDNPDSWTESLPKSHTSFFKKPEDFSKPGAWGQVARKINICGGIFRHRWYQFGQKQVKANSMNARQATANKPH